MYMKMEEMFNKNIKKITSIDIFLTFALVLFTFMLFMTFTGCSTSGRTYNVGTGELLPKTKKVN
jgi:hypothetical protein